MDNLARILEDPESADQGVEKRLFEFLYVRFYQIAKNRLRGREDIKDIVQEACITVFEKYKQMNSVSNPEAWACEILRKKIGNYIQRRKSTKKHLTYEYDPDKVATVINPQSGIILKIKMADCLKKIFRGNKRYARILVLAYRGYKADEIGKKLKIKRDNVYTILNRSRAMLRRCIAAGKVGQL